MCAGELSNLIHILQLAYSGELAAAYAYRGHWQSARKETERVRIHQIEDEEWHHRELVGGMLRELKAQPDSRRAARYAARSGHLEIIDCLLTMAEVEWEHEKYFRLQVEKHYFSRYFRLWPSLPPKETIRNSFVSETS